MHGDWCQCSTFRWRVYQLWTWKMASVGAVERAVVKPSKEYRKWKWNKLLGKNRLHFVKFGIQWTSVIFFWGNSLCSAHPNIQYYIALSKCFILPGTQHGTSVLELTTLTCRNRMCSLQMQLGGYDLNKCQIWSCLCMVKYLDDQATHFKVCPHMWLA